MVLGLLLFVGLAIVVALVVYYKNESSGAPPVPAPPAPAPPVPAPSPSETIMNEIISAERIPLYSVYNRGNSCTSTIPDVMCAGNGEVVTGKKIIGWVLKKPFAGKTTQIKQKYKAAFNDFCIAIGKNNNCHGEVNERDEEAYVLNEAIPGKTIELLVTYSSKESDLCAYVKGGTCHGAELNNSPGTISVAGHIFENER